MLLIEKATRFVLGALLENEEFKKFPQDFITASVQWVRSWFLEDEPRLEEKIKSPDRTEDNKRGLVESKTERLIENPQFLRELEARLAEYERHAAAIQHTVNQDKVIQNSSINTGGGDFRQGDDRYTAGGNIQIVHNYGPQGGDAASKPTPPVVKPIVDPGVKETLRQLIAGNRTKDAIDQLLNLSVQHPEFRNLVLQQSERWQQLKRNEMMSVISFSEANIERAKIVSAVLNLMSELDER